MVYLILSILITGMSIWRGGKFLEEDYDDSYSSIFIDRKWWVDPVFAVLLLLHGVACVILLILGIASIYKQAVLFFFG